MDPPIVAHITQNTHSCSYWLYITKTNPLWGQLNQDLIRYIYWTIFERHPAQIWHDRIYKEITSDWPMNRRRIWRLCIPSKYGKTYMAKRLRKYYDTITDMKKHRIHVGDEHSKLDWATQGMQLLIICSSNFYRMETERYGVQIEYRELKL